MRFKYTFARRLLLLVSLLLLLFVEVCSENLYEEKQSTNKQVAQSPQLDFSDVTQEDKHVIVEYIPYVKNVGDAKRVGFPKTIYYIRHFQAKHNVDSTYDHVLDPDLTDYGFQQGSKAQFHDDQLELIICSPLSRAIQTYLSLFNDTTKRERIRFELDADLQELGSNLADTPRTKTALKEKFPHLSSIIDRDLDENFNDKNNPLYSASASRVKERVTRFHQRLLKQYSETRIMIVTHGGWLSIEFNGRSFANGQIVKQIYEHEDDVASSYKDKVGMQKNSICFLLFSHFILLYSN